jgi:uncharacterized protein (DUF885 family)
MFELLFEKSTSLMKYSILVLLFISCQSESIKEHSTQQALYDIFEGEKIFSEKEFPSWTDTESAVDPFPEINPTAQKRRADYWSELVAKMEGLNKAELSKQDQINYDLFKFILEDKIAQVAFESYLTPISGDGGFHVDFVYMRNRFSFKSEAEFERYLTILEGFKHYSTENMSLLKLGQSKGKMLPKAVLKGYESYIDPHIVSKAEDSYFYEPFNKFSFNISDERKDNLRNRAKTAITTSIVPGYQLFKDFIQNEYRPNARESIGISSEPQGKEYYQQRIEYFTTLPLNADEIFEIGEQEVSRIKAQMETIIKEVNFKGSFADFLNFLRTDDQFYAKSPRELMREASYLAKKIDGKLPQAFNLMPRLPYGVAPVPDAIAPKYTAGRYSPGSAADHRAGFYWVNTFKLESRPLYALPALTLHEAVPGHHLQISLAEEMEGVPDFRKSTYLSCYGEGWALYCEWLGQELGIYETPYDHFGRLTYEMWRACRLVVDVGIHAKNWSRDQAVDFMASNTALSLHEVNTEIDRYIGWPGQAISYKIGELKIRELRKKAEKELGEHFDLRRFHDVILENGAVPLFILEELVEEYIKLAAE